MPAPAMCAVLLCSPDAEALKEWYRDAFDTEENEHGALVFGDIDIYIENHSQITGPTAEPARMMICLNLEEFSSVEEHLRSRGVRFVRQPETTGFGQLATVEDPDGNFVQLTQWRVPRSSA
jgi:predicted enzyme related to lactoylglutathione lyase